MRGDPLVCVEPVYDLERDEYYCALEDDYRLTVCVEALTGASVSPDHAYEVDRFRFATPAEVERRRREILQLAEQVWMALEEDDCD